MRAVRVPSRLLAALTGGLLVFSGAVAMAPPAGAVGEPANDLLVSPNFASNTDTSRVLTMTTSGAITYVNGATAVQVVGPGAFTETFTGTSTSVSGNSVTSTVNFVDANGTPAGPGVYKVFVCQVDCSAPTV